MHHFIKTHKFTFNRLVGSLFLLMLVGTIFQCGKETPLPGSSRSNDKATAMDIYPYSANGHIFSWKNSSQIDVLLPSDKNVDKTKNPQYDDSYRVQAEKAINKWNNVLATQGIRLNIIETGPNDIKILWVPANDLPNGVIGSAELDGRRVESSRVVKISTTPLDIGGKASHAQRIYKIVAHEFGHILGLWSHSTDREDLMYPYINEDVNDLSIRDIVTFKYLYQVAPDAYLQSLPKNSSLTENGSSNQLPKNFSSISCSLNAKTLSFEITHNQ